MIPERWEPPLLEAPDEPSLPVEPGAAEPDVGWVLMKRRDFDFLFRPALDQAGAPNRFTLNDTGSILREVCSQVEPFAHPGGAIMALRMKGYPKQFSICLPASIDFDVITPGSIVIMRSYEDSQDLVRRMHARVPVRATSSDVLSNLYADASRNGGFNLAALADYERMTGGSQLQQVEALAPPRGTLEQGLRDSHLAHSLGIPRRRLTEMPDPEEIEKKWIPAAFAAEQSRALSSSVNPTDQRPRQRPRL
ncbi:MULTISPECIES: hypothetical protein [unclassified Thioalkalivibrio]|uniref:hypothetical protein n=1 Tax=unclassified Thioalkalivibrio TaxID=2621013 RepID=UPI001E564E10|nr:MULTISPECIES: hypothetical protein [unclassified Thioalkalivibrio]